MRVWYRLLVPWIIVIGEQAALEWVLASERMGFRDTTYVPHIDVGDRFALYTTRGAFHNPTRDESQIVALGEFASKVQHRAVKIDDCLYPRSCKLHISAQLEPRHGLPFRPLVSQLNFIQSKHGWAATMRRTLVSLGPADYATIERAFKSQRK
jgi:hypothetical protein